jgi:inner membrane transporter RhtA
VTSAPLDRVPAWMLASAAMLSVQLGAAISVGLFDEIGVAGTAWLRLTLGALGFILIARPRYWQWSWRELRAPILLGVVSAGMTLCFLAAIDLLPLGTAVAIEFLGPLSVAAIHSHSRRALAWPALALVGVVLLTEPWQGTPSLLGITFAALAGVGWGLYIVITQHVGDRFAGVDGLAISLPVAAIVTAVVGLPQAWGHLSMQVLLVGLGAAILLPLIPWTFELYALRRLTKAAFGTLMALEPAIALVIGIVVLHQSAAVWQFVGIACVVLAGIAAERTGHREDELPDLGPKVT